MLEGGLYRKDAWRRRVRALLGEYSGFCLGTMTVKEIGKSEIEETEGRGITDLFAHASSFMLLHWCSV